jgi:hypothetical protein
MKYALALILSVCALFAFSGCAKMKGERIEFGHSYPCKNLQGKVYYITYSDDAARIRELKETAGRLPCDRALQPVADRGYDYCGGNHSELLEIIDKYHEGFFGWF